MRIGKPRIYKKDGWTYLSSEIVSQETSREVFFSVENEYGKYLVDDRIDAFVVALMTIAMRHGEDIVSDAPITKRLKYQLEHYLIPAMAANMNAYNSISILCPVVDETFSSEGAVATGWTGGVDSMYTLYKHHREDSLYLLTHLLIANNGAIEAPRDVFLYMVDHARRGIASELGLKVIAIDSNIQEVEREHYLAVACFRLSAVVLAVQKLIKVFLCSAAYEIANFSFSEDNCFYYELLALSMFATDATYFHSAFGSVKRIDKIKELADFEIAKRYLHPCIYVKQGDNCTKCEKCIRTAGALYAMGKLGEFERVFDVEAFEHDWEKHLAYLLAREGNEHNREVVSLYLDNGNSISNEVKRDARRIRAIFKAVEKNRSIREERLGHEA